MRQENARMGRNEEGLVYQPQYLIFQLQLKQYFQKEA